MKQITQYFLKGESQTLKKSLGKMYETECIPEGSVDQISWTAAIKFISFAIQKSDHSLWLNLGKKILIFLNFKIFNCNFFQSSIA